MRPSTLRKYGEARLPRYTSYPTAPFFSPTIGSSTYAAWLAGLPHDQPASLYLHIPFCRSMCWYCGCHTTITSRDQPIVDYLSLLRREIAMVADIAGSPLPVTNVHFGGGTPTIMEAAEFAALMGLLRERFTFADEAEISIEIDPRRLERDMAAQLGASGVNRASLGVQSFDPAVQKAVNRIQSEEQTFAAVTELRRAGIAGINFDLIYGLPLQTVQSCVETALAAVAMRPTRLAVFGYAHVPSFKKHQRVIDTATLPDGEARREQALAIAATLTAAGYIQIGLDHFALPDDDLAVAQAAGTLRRNFQGYTTDACETLLGFGASAIGHMAQGYVQNEVNLADYARWIETGSLATARGYQLSEEDHVRAAVIERLMCDFAADVPTICGRHGFDAARLLAHNGRLAALAEEGVVSERDGVIRVEATNRFLIRTVAAAFDAYLEESDRVYSKTA